MWRGTEGQSHRAHRAGSGASALRAAAAARAPTASLGPRPFREPSGEWSDSGRLRVRSGAGGGGSHGSTRLAAGALPPRRRRRRPEPGSRGRSGYFSQWESLAGPGLRTALAEARAMDEEIVSEKQAEESHRQNWRQPAHLHPAAHAYHSHDPGSSSTAGPASCTKTGLAMIYGKCLNPVSAPGAPPFSVRRLHHTSWLCSAYVRLPSHCFHFLPRLSPGSPFLSVAPFFSCFTPRFSASPHFFLSLVPVFSASRPPFLCQSTFSLRPHLLFLPHPHLRLCLPSSGPRTEDGKGVGAVSQIGLRDWGEGSN